MKNKKIILIGGKGLSTNIVFNSLNDKFGITLAILEKRENIKVFIKRRIKKLGLITVIGQIVFQLLLVKPLHFFSKKRINEILKNNLLNSNEIPKEKLKIVESINSTETIQLLKNISPDLIIVNGTRIISPKFLSVVNCKVINTHPGITPKYRGFDGTYWALVNNDIENCGVTVHFVDRGIDTGEIIYQSKVVPTRKDNFTTYLILQLSEGIKILINAIEGYFEDKISIKNGPEESNVWYPPTLWEYIYNRIFKNVK